MLPSEIIKAAEVYAYRASLTGKDGSSQNAIEELAARRALYDAIEAYAQERYGDGYTDGASDMERQ